MGDRRASSTRCRATRAGGAERDGLLVSEVARDVLALDVAENLCLVHSLRRLGHLVGRGGLPPRPPVGRPSLGLVIADRLPAAARG